ncbi:hypothetical protein [Psychrobacillus psychrotolerans]|uniref:hypothetical protein n=1 Tax=Psychrobacillus psychrotolerans TaxID=126156 RepID=UPI003315A327
MNDDYAIATKVGSRILFFKSNIYAPRFIDNIDKAKPVDVKEANKLKKIFETNSNKIFYVVNINEHKKRLKGRPSNQPIEK